MHLRALQWLTRPPVARQSLVQPPPVRRRDAERSLALRSPALRRAAARSLVPPSLALPSPARQSPDNPSGYCRVAGGAGVDPPPAMLLRRVRTMNELEAAEVVVETITRMALEQRPLMARVLPAGDVHIWAHYPDDDARDGERCPAGTTMSMRRENAIPPNTDISIFSCTEPSSKTRRQCLLRLLRARMRRLM